MAAIDFPSSPSNGDTHTVGGVTYTYNSAETKWKTTINSNNFLPLTGGTLSGNLNMGTNDLTVGDVTASGTASLSGLTYPTSDGTSGQYLQTNGSGALSFATVATPTVAFESYAVIGDQKPAATNGGNFPSGSWVQRELNTEFFDADGIVSISGNQFTLGAGTYLICWNAPAFDVNRHQTRLYDVTNTSALRSGTSEYANATSNVQTRSFGWHRVTITANTTYAIQHRCQSTAGANGLGIEANFGEPEVYSVVQIYKEA